MGPWLTRLIVVLVVASTGLPAGAVGLGPAAGSSPAPDSEAGPAAGSSPAPDSEAGPAAGGHPALLAEATPTWGTAANGRKAGRVMAVVEHRGVVFLAGEFTGMVPPGAGDDVDPVPRRYLAALDVATGDLTSFDAGVDAPVRALVLSDDGRRLYLGGDFNSVGGRPARKLAAVDPSTGELDASFQPPRLNSGVRALALHGDRLYAGGVFTSINVPGGPTHDRPQLAAFHARTGVLLDDWLPPENGGGRFFGQTGRKTYRGDGVVRSLALSGDGRTLHVAGTFLDFGGQSGLLSLDTVTGEPTRWQAGMDRPVFGVALWPGDGRTFFAAAGGAGGRFFAFDPGGSTKKPVWEVKTDGDNVGVVASHRAVYLFGHFDYIVSARSSCFRHCPGGPERRHLAAFDPATGELHPWAPKANTSTGPYTGAIGANHLWVGGEFTEINRTPQPGIAQFPGVP